MKMKLLKTVRTVKADSLWLVSLVENAEKKLLEMEKKL